MAEHDDHARVAEALARVRDLVEAQLPLLHLPERSLDPATLERFSQDLPQELSNTERERLESEVERLSPWLQGPFYLGGDLVIEGVWRIDERWRAMVPYVPDVAGKRVLDVGSNAGYDAFMFHVRGAREVVACEPFEFIAQARFLESVYRTGVKFEPIGWQQLDPGELGTFDLVHCNGVLYHEPNPLAMLQSLRKMLSPDGELLLGSMMLASAERSEYARFVRHDYAGDPTWWWVPGRLALRWMVDACGLDPELLPLRFGGPGGSFEVINGYVRARLSTPDPSLAEATSTRPRASRSNDGNSGPALHVSSAPSAAGDTGSAAINRFPIGHYYSPMYDTRELATQRDRLWPARPRDTLGIDWRDKAQLDLCRRLAATRQFEFAERSTEDPTIYFASNDQYPPLDAWVLSGLLQELRPRRMIEVGCGFSTLISARTNRELLNGGMHLTCIEPYPREFLAAGVPGVSELRVEKVEDSPLELFEQLGGDDILFIDTSHTVKTGNDVTWLFQEIIPRLAPGVVVHIHDVFVPGEYPETWVMQGWGWNESYLVRAFLSYNEEFPILWGAQYMLLNHLETVRTTFPGLRRYTPSGGSLWLRRRDG